MRFRTRVVNTLLTWNPTPHSTTGQESWCSEVGNSLEIPDTWQRSKSGPCKKNQASHRSKQIALMVDSLLFEPLGRRTLFHMRCTPQSHGCCLSSEQVAREFADRIAVEEKSNYHSLFGNFWHYPETEVWTGAKFDSGTETLANIASTPQSRRCNRIPRITTWFGIS